MAKLQSTSLTRRALLVGGSAALASAAGCGQPSAASTGNRHLRLLGEATLPFGARFGETPVGGLSGIDFDAASGEYLLISDDRSDRAPARAYRATWRPDAAGTAPDMTALVSLRQPDGAPWPGHRNQTEGVPVPDPESIRLRRGTGTLLWTSEGDIGRGFGPSLYEASSDGVTLREFGLPAMFRPDKTGQRGPRDNRGFEGLALTPDGQRAWLAMEGALIGDGPLPTADAAGGPCRFTEVDLASGIAVRQIAYPPDAIPLPTRLPGGFADNGVSEILMLDAHRMLVLERAWSPGAGNSLRLYEIDTRAASDTLAVGALRPGNHRPAPKTLLADFATLGLSRLDNTEGMCWGPPLPDDARGRRQRMLVVVSDNNFNPLQITQFAAFAYTDRP